MSPSALSTPANPDSEGGMSPSRLAGDSPASQSPSPSGPGMGQGQLSSAIEQVRGMEQSLKSLSRSYPQATEAIRKAVEGVRGVLKVIVANSGSGQSEPPAPSGMLG